MSKWKMLAPYPGGQVPPFNRIVKPGDVFETTDDTPARESWLPLDTPAKAAVERQKAVVVQMVKDLARSKPPDARRFETISDRIDGAPAPDPDAREEAYDPYGASKGKSVPHVFVTPDIAKKSL